jgi:hypothetical protein
VGNTLYYVFLVALTLGLATHLVNMIFFRAKSRTLFGQSYKLGSQAQRRLSKLSNNRNLFITFTLALLATIALIMHLVQLVSSGVADVGILIFGLLATLAFYVVMILVSLAKSKPGAED